MRETTEQLIARVDQGLGRAACELVLASGDEAGTVRELLTDVAAALEGADAPGVAALARVAREAAGLALDAMPAKLAQLEAGWNGWKAAQFAASDAPVEYASITVPALVSPQALVDNAFVSTDDEIAMLVADAELAGMFIAEALDHLSSIEALVLQVETQPDDVKLLNDVFRPFHTIKGNAGALGVTSVQELAHRVENLLDLARSGRHMMGAGEIDAVLKAVDLLTTMVQGLTARIAGQAAPDVSGECRALATLIDSLISGEAASEAPAAAVATPAIVVEARAVEVPAPAAVAIVATPDAEKTPAPKAAGKPQARAAEDSLQAVKVDTRKLDNLVDMVGELVIVQSIIREDPALARLADERLTRHLAQLKRITSDLQRNAMSMRMTPIRPTFQKMSRLVRDLSKKSGKQIDLVLSGEDTELDRKVVEDINDPLMHMVRNSVDHGIEAPEARRAAGKPAQARVALTAGHEGGNIVIAIEDDGAGLNTERIRAKAIAQGLIDAHSDLTPAEIHELIFRPGFSTAEKITEISGRGVGMDVVRRNIEALRGRIEIQSVAGQGTKFAIKLPLTLAILEGLLLRIGQERFVLPTFSVRESLRPSQEQVHSMQGRRRLIQVRDTLLPMIHLSELFGASGPMPEPWESTVVVIEDNDRRVGLMVDELLGKQEVVIKALGEAFSGVRGVAGGAILGDGRVGLILDAGGLVSLMDKPLEQAA